MTTNDKPLGPCPLCGEEARHGTSAPVGETWTRLSSIAADARRVEELLRENIQLRLEQSARVLDTSEYRDLLEDRQKQLCEVFRMREVLERIRLVAMTCQLTKNPEAEEIDRLYPNLPAIHNDGLTPTELGLRVIELANEFRLGQMNL